MSDERDVVGLLHRADWTRLSLSAQVSDGSAVLVAPGRRYRHEDAGYLTGCDGGRPWQMSRDDDDDDHGSVHWISEPEAPLSRLLCPAWLLEDSSLRVLGQIRACGRNAFDVEVTCRPGSLGGPRGPAKTAVRARVLVDAELGILLRLAEPGPDPAEPEVTELGER